MFANKNQKDYPEKIFKLHFMFADVTSFFLRLSVNSKEVYPVLLKRGWKLQSQPSNRVLLRQETLLRSSEFNYLLN